MKRDWLTLAFGVVLVGTVVALSLRQNMSHPPGEPSAPAAQSAPAPALTPAAATDPSAARSAPARNDTTPAAARGKPKSITPARPSEPAATPADTGVSLQVQSDVAGASVFIDREFVGTTPLTLRGLTTGQKQLNVSATGHEGYASTIDLTPGANVVNVDFVKGRLNATGLNASVPVVHRHAMGSCQGMLIASPKGLTYDTTNTPDAFTIAFAELDEFDVDYLKKNLRIHRRAGRTWNFTNDNADALFVFHRDVAKAKEKLH